MSEGRNFTDLLFIVFRVIEFLKSTSCDTYDPSSTESNELRWFSILVQQLLKTDKTRLEIFFQIMKLFFHDLLWFFVCQLYLGKHKKKLHSDKLVLSKPPKMSQILKYSSFIFKICYGLSRLLDCQKINKYLFSNA